MALSLPVPTAPIQVEPEAGAKPGWALEAGQEIVPGRYALALLGGGNRYEAYLAWDERLFTTAVAKLLRPHLIGDPKALEGLAREARALTELQHPVLVRSFDAVLDGARPHLLLEHLDGPRLSTLLRKYGPLSAEQLVLLARQLCSALHYVAGAGWLHLDVKPRNIIVTASPRLIDLSVARPLEQARAVTSYVGTEAYMAPEQCDPERFAEIGPWSDVWGLGATLYEALTGRPAFPRSSDGERFPQLTAELPEIPAKAPPVLASALEAALQPDPGDRPTAGELYESLESLAGWSHRRARKLH
jgi:serine/threonine protein kinase